MKRGSPLGRKRGLSPGGKRLQQRKSIERGPGPKRSGRINPVNRDRKKKRHARHFGEKAVWIRTQPCVVSGQRSGVEAAHVRSRGAGGDARSLVPLHADLHREQHAVGILTFQARHQVDLTAEADRYERMWKRLQEEG